MEPRRETKNEVRDNYSTANPFPTFPDAQESYSRGLAMVSFALARHGALPGAGIGSGRGRGYTHGSVQEAIVQCREA